jgi:hypothetical protein
VKQELNVREAGVDRDETGAGGEREKQELDKRETRAG